MIHLSSYHSNGLPTVVWSNKVNLIGEKVYKPKIHFCEHCNKPILIYGRLIPCKHVFCFTCATLCLTQQSIKTNSPTPNIPGPSEPPPVPNNHWHQSPILNNNSTHHSPQNNNNSYNGGSSAKYGSNNSNHNSNDRHHTNHRQSKVNSNKNTLELHRSDSNQSFSLKDNTSGSLLNLDESTSNTTPTTIQQETINSPNLNGSNGNSLLGHVNAGKGCHRCGGKALRVERNTLNSIFVCKVETCRRTYLSARDLQAHVTHRHSKNKTNAGASSASLAAISASPYISSSSLLHLNSHNQGNNHRLLPAANAGNQNNSNHNTNNSPSQHNHHNRHDREHHRHHRERDRFRDRDSYQRDRERERDSKEYHRQSLQRAAQWAEASAQQMLEKGITR